MQNKIELVIFDMDDLMIDSAPVHTEIFDATLKEYGASIHDRQNPFTKQEQADIAGKRIIDIFEYLREKYGLKVSAEELHQKYNDLLLPIFEKRIVSMPGLTPLVISLKENNYNLAIASSSTRRKIDIVLKKLNLTKYFGVIVSGEDVKHGKPAPDIFLKAAQDANISPERAVVLEDAKNGIAAAKNAGMYVIGVHNKFEHERLGARQDLSAADLELESLEEISPELIKNLSSTR